MVSKTEIALSLCGTNATASMRKTAQYNLNIEDDNWVFDSSKISTKSMPQHNEFVNYQNPIHQNQACGN